MSAFSENLLNSLASTQSDKEVFNVLLTAARHLGFEYCAYGLKLPLPVTNPKIAICNNYPKTWQDRYQQAGYLTIDPTVQHGLRTTIPLIWNDDIFSTTKKLWFEARENGLRVPEFDTNRAKSLIPLNPVFKLPLQPATQGSSALLPAVASSGPARP